MAHTSSWKKNVLRIKNGLTHRNSMISGKRCRKPWRSPNCPSQPDWTRATAMWCLWLIEADTPFGKTGAPSLLWRMADVAAAAASDMPSSARRIANRPPRNPSCSNRVRQTVEISRGHRLQVCGRSWFAANVGQRWYLVLVLVNSNTR